MAVDERRDRESELIQSIVMNRQAGRYRGREGSILWDRGLIPRKGDDRKLWRKYLSSVDSTFIAFLALRDSTSLDNMYERSFLVCHGPPLARCLTPSERLVLSD